MEFFVALNPIKIKLMKSILRITVITLLLLISFQSCKKTAKTTVVEENYAAENYTKKEVAIEMRDGVKLYTTIYSPKDTSQEYPIVMQRTPYSSRPYGEENFRPQIGPNINMMKEGYHVVYQDVRGRWKSEGHYENMRAYIPNKTDSAQVDESSDTYDTIEWLVNNVENNNGRVGLWEFPIPVFMQPTEPLTLTLH